MLSNQVQGQGGGLGQQVDVGDGDAGNVSDVGEGETSNRNAGVGGWQPGFTLWAEIKLELRDVVRVDQGGEVHGDGTVHVVLVLGRAAHLSLDRRDRGRGEDPQPLQQRVSLLPVGVKVELVLRSPRGVSSLCQAGLAMDRVV